MALVFVLVRLAIAAAVLVFAYHWRAPFTAGIRLPTLLGLVAGTVALMALEVWLLRRGRDGRPLRLLSRLSLIVAGTALVTSIAVEARFQWLKQFVLRADPAQLTELGRHIVVGYRDDHELRGLIERRALAGVFLLTRNVAGRSAAEIGRDIAGWQALRRAQNLPPLWISADQEGGLVSRLTPPLLRLPPLAQVIADAADSAQRQRAVAAYADGQGTELAALGVNLNLAPVVDLNHRVVNPGDRYSRISLRAIASDPEIVAESAAFYCATLARHGVACTLKHFPGLGRVFEDTHTETATLDTPTDLLARTDWIPFRRLMQTEPVLVMLSHARLAALDRTRPVSFSRPVIDGLLRRQWGYDGVLITDDFSMGAVYTSTEGVAGGALAALQAGVDLVLVSYDTDQYYPIMYRLLQARAAGELDPARLAASTARIDRLGGNILQPKRPNSAADAR